MGGRKRGGASGSERSQGSVLYGTEEAFGVAPGSEGVKKGFGSCVKVLNIGADAVEADELRFDYTLECMFWVVTGFME